MLYRSEDLGIWDGPKTLFEPPGDWWGQGRLGWAPELHRWNGRWYLFSSWATRDDPRVESDDIAGTSILVPDHVEGPYEPTRNGPTHTDRPLCPGRRPRGG